MSKIKVHLLNFWGPINSHSEIILEQATEQGNLYYQIDIGSSPQKNGVINSKTCLESLNEASESHIIEIDNELNDIIKAWQQKYTNDEKDFSCISYNCADISSWFLEEFANIPNPGNCNSPITTNYLCCGIFAPSFLQCCTLPGRVFDYAKAAKSDEINEVLKLTVN
jgi:hypothetical protein